MAAERRAKHAWRLVAAVVVLVIVFLGFVGGWMGHGLFHQQTFIVCTFVEDAAAAHQVSTVDLRHPVEVTALESEHLTTWLSKRLNIPVVQADLSGTGFEVIGGRLLFSRSAAPAVMLMYLDSEGIRVTICIARNRGAEPSSLRFFSSGEGRIESVYWFDREIGYGLTRAHNRETLLKLAKDFLRAMDGA
jgi:anti-sigma factor RsiW